MRFNIFSPASLTLSMVFIIFLACRPISIQHVSIMAEVANCIHVFEVHIRSLFVTQESLSFHDSILNGAAAPPF